MVPFVAAAETSVPAGPITLTAPPSCGTDTRTRQRFAAAVVAGLGATRAGTFRIGATV